jgi:hypothetical protein
VSLSAEVEREALERQLDAACAELGDNEIRVVLLIAKRLVMGRKAYGALDIHGDRRDGRHENFPRQAVDALRVLGHDVLTTEEAAKASLSDPGVLKYASENLRIVLTYNRKDFIRLHNESNDHCGIVVAHVDLDTARLA